jgi:hypothetical protein
MKRLSILAALLILVAACSGGDNATTSTAAVISSTGTVGATREGATTTTTTTTTTRGTGAAATEAPGATGTSPQLDDPFDVVVAFYGALSAEDVEGMVALWPSGDRELFRLRTVGLNQKVSATCFPGDAGEGSVRCEDSVVNDDFHSPAGRGAAVTVTYVVEDGAILQSEVVGWPEEWDRYEEAFGAWLETAHPNLYDSAFQGQGDYPFETAEDALAVIAVLDEFLAQSDEYPVAE